MLGGLWLVYSCFGLVSSSIAPLVSPVSADLGLSRSAMGSVLGSWQLIYLATAIPCGALVDRIGLRWSLAAGAFVVMLSGALRAVSVNYATLFLAVAVFGLGGPLISIGAPKLITVWFNQKDRGLALGIYSTSSAIGGIAALSTANSVLMPLTGQSWRLTVAVYAAVALLAVVLWLLLARDPERYSGKSPGPAAAGLYSIQPFVLLLRMRVVQIVLLISIGTFLFTHGLNNWLPEILRAGGMTPTQAGFWAAIPTVVGIAGTLTIARLATPARRIPILIVLFLSTGVGIVLLATSSGIPLVSGLLLQGFARGGVMPVAILVLMDTPQIGSRNMGAAAGLYFTAGEIGGVLGPTLIGVMADLSGGFFSGLLMVAGVCVVLVFLTIALGMVLHRQAQRDAVGDQGGLRAG